MDAKLKHLEFIQSAIGRMSSHSSLYKGWAVTVAVGLSALAAVNTRAALLFIAIVSNLLFWGLDGYYLWLERAFVKLHNEVSVKAENEIDFSMRIDKSHAFSEWLKTCTRYHLVGFYGAIMLIDIIAISLVQGGHNGS